MTRTSAIAAGWLLLAAVLAWPAPAQAQGMKVILDASGVDRSNSPVTVALPAGGKYASGPVSLRAADGSIIPGYLAATPSPQLLLIVPRLAADAKLELTVEPAAATSGDAAKFSFVEAPGHRDLMRGQTPVLRHMTAWDPQNDRLKTYKPYTHVMGSDGQPITKGPGGAFTHHRGIFLAWAKTTVGSYAADWWHCPKAAQKHDHFIPEDEIASTFVARSTAVNHWLGEDNTTIYVKDHRRFTTWQLADGLMLIDLDVTIEPTDKGPVTLKGDPQHAGVHFRADQSVHENQKSTSYLFPEGAQVKPNTVATNAQWVACTFPIRGQLYTILHASDPANPKPLTYSIRDYARFGAFFETTVQPDAPLKLRYRFAVIDRTKHPQVDQASLAAMYADFASPVKATVK